MMNANIPTSNASGADVYGELRETLGIDDDDNRRLRTRSPWNASLTVWVMDEPVVDRSLREIQVDTTDISPTGLGFVFRQYIHPGAMLRIRLEGLPGKPIIDAIVAHCHVDDDAIHRVGVQFVSAI